MVDQTRYQMNSWRWGNPRAFGDQVDRSNPQRTSSGKYEHTIKRSSWYGSDDLGATIEQPSSRQFKPGYFLAVISLNWGETIDEDVDDETGADSRAPSGEGSRPGNGNDSVNGDGEKETQGGEKATGKGKVTQDGKGKGNWKGKWMGKGKGKGTAMEEGRGRGREMVKGKVLLNKHQGEMISVMVLRCSCRSKCTRQTRTRRDNYSRYI